MHSKPRTVPRLVHWIRARKDVCALVGLLLFYVAVESICIGCHSPAIDETAHLPAGLSHFETGRIELYAVNPPLVRLLASLPVYAIGPNHDWSRHNSDISARAEFPVSKDFFSGQWPDYTSLLCDCAACSPALSCPWYHRRFPSWSASIYKLVWRYRSRHVGS